jgi:hypothetical protein
MALKKSFFVFYQFMWILSLKSDFRATYIRNGRFNHQICVSPYPNYLKTEKNSKLNILSFLVDLKAFSDFWRLDFAERRSYRQNGVEIRELFTRNTQKEIKIHKPFMVHF